MRYTILNILREKKGYVSGEELGDMLGVSRAAIWKSITKLKEEGYEINSVNKKGYCLDDSKDILNKHELKYDNAIYLKETDSTNNECKRQAEKGCADGLLVVSEYQSKGKGRLGRAWSSEPSAGLYMSIVLKPEISPSEAPQLTLIAGMAVTKAIRSITGLKVGIKWPNDVVINGKKLCGILTEMSAEIDRIKYVVTGIGVNINNSSFDAELKNKATSIYIETGKSYKRSVFADTIVNELMGYYDIFCKKGFSGLRDEYNKYCLNKGKIVRTTGKNAIKGKALGVNDRGELLIETDTSIVPVLSGEVSLRLENNKYI